MAQPLTATSHRRLDGKPFGRRRFAACVLLVVQFLTLARAQTNFTADMERVRQLGVITQQQTLVPFAQQEFGNYPTMTPEQMQALSLRTNTPESSAAANIERIGQCRDVANRNFEGMTDRQKIECQSVITAAQIRDTPNPYLDPKTPVAHAIQSEATSTRTRADRMVATGAVTSPSSVTASTSCQTHLTDVPTVMREDRCPIDKPSEPRECTIRVINTVNPARNTVLAAVLSDDEWSTCPDNFNPYCEGADTICTKTDTIEVGKDENGEPILVEVCVEKKRGFTCWRPEADWLVPWPCHKLDENPTCRQTGIKPLKYVSTALVLAERIYSCELTPPSTAAMGSNCATTFCIGDTCVTNPPQASPDFGRAIVGMEVLREAGVYAYGSEENLRLFRGIQNSCSDPVVGKNCCASASGAPLMTNRDILPQMQMQFAGNVISSTGRYAWDQASNYVYDYMFTSGNEWLIQQADSAFVSGAWNGPFGTANGFNFSFGMYGFSMTVGAASNGIILNAAINAFGGTTSVVGGALNMLGPAGNLWQYTTTAFGPKLTFAFNPYVLVLMIVIMIIMELMSCSADEKMLSTRRGAGLCTQLRRYCSWRLPFFGTCMEYKEDWCCWNSRLAQIIGTQGAAQLGSGPRCDGLTPAELARIDFSKIDLSSFMNEVMQSVALPDGTYHASTMLQGNMRSYEARDSVNAQSYGAQASSPQMVDYTTGRVQMMLNR
jgi:conjugal transfer mating pair stabilization protein TraN